MRHIVLVGVGHTHALVVRRWLERPIAGARLTCVSDHPRATYSGMLPGVLAGQYDPEQMEIDLARLCAAARVALVVDDACTPDVVRRRIVCRGGAVIDFDLLSVGVGSTVGLAGALVAPGARVVPVKPMQTLLARLDAALAHLRDSTAGPPRLLVVGAGAGGLEIALTLPRYVQARLGAPMTPSTTVVDAGDLPLSGSGAGTRRRVLRALGDRGARIVLGRRVTAVEASVARLDDGQQVGADLVVWATGAEPQPMIGRLGLPTCPRGFLLTDDTLRSVSGEPVWAVGDAGTIEGAGVPKAGVYAVRQGPVLWENLRRAVEGRGQPQRYRPQRAFLKLLNTGDGRAIGEWRGVSFEGRWCWRLKDAIDRRFIGRFRQVP